MLASDGVIWQSLALGKMPRSRGAKIQVARWPVARSARARSEACAARFFRGGLGGLGFELFGEAIGFGQLDHFKPALGVAAKVELVLGVGDACFFDGPKQPSAGGLVEFLLGQKAPHGAFEALGQGARAQSQKLAAGVFAEGGFEEVDFFALGAEPQDGADFGLRQAR